MGKRVNSRDGAGGCDLTAGGQVPPEVRTRYGGVEKSTGPQENRRPREKSHRFPRAPFEESSDHGPEVPLR